MNEPNKYEKNETGVWKLNPVWKEWKDRKFKQKQKSKFKGTPSRIVTEDSHVPRWKEVAYNLSTGRAVLFCCCMAGTSEPFKGCGAVAIRNSKNSQIQIVLESRFE